jgi:guanine deaminase
LDIMNSMRHAVAVSRIREGERIMKADDSIPQPDERILSVDWKESLFLATRGGSTALGYEGVFKVGAPFDAQESKLLRFDGSSE